MIKLIICEKDCSLSILNNHSCKIFNIKMGVLILTAKKSPKGFHCIIFSFYSHSFRPFHPASLPLACLFWLTLDRAAVTCQNQRFGTVKPRGRVITTLILGHCYTPNTKLSGVELNKEKGTQKYP